MYFHITIHTCTGNFSGLPIRTGRMNMERNGDFASGVPLEALLSRIPMTTDTSVRVGKNPDGVFLAPKHFQQFLQGQHVLIKMNNSIAVEFINCQGGHSLATDTQIGSADNHVEQHQALVSLGDTYARCFKQGMQICCQGGNLFTGSGLFILSWWIRSGRGTARQP